MMTTTCQRWKYLHWTLPQASTSIDVNFQLLQMMQQMQLQMRGFQATMAAIVTVIVMKLEDQAKQLDKQASTVDGRLTELSSQLDVKLAKQLEVIRQELTQMVDTKLGDLERSIVHKVRKKIADPCAEIHRAVDEKIEATFQKTYAYISTVHEDCTRAQGAAQKQMELAV